MVLLAALACASAPDPVSGAGKPEAADAPEVTDAASTGAWWEEPPVDARKQLNRDLLCRRGDATLNFLPEGRVLGRREGVDAPADGQWAWSDGLLRWQVKWPDGTEEGRLSDTRAWMDDMAIRFACAEGVLSCRMDREDIAEVGAVWVAVRGSDARVGPAAASVTGWAARVEGDGAPQVLYADPSHEDEAKAVLEAVTPLLPGATLAQGGDAPITVVTP